MKNYKNIHRDFTEELINDWVMQGFNYNQTADWINIGLNPTDAYYAGYLRDIKDKDCEWALNYGDDKLLRNEYKLYQINYLNNLNAPNHNPQQPFLTTNKLLIMAGLTIAAYLLIKYV